MHAKKRTVSSEDKLAEGAEEMELLEFIKSNRVYLDGGFGTMLQEKGLKPGEFPESWNITNPDVIENIHYEYLKAGCDILTANTFGANGLKFNSESEFSLEDIISAAIKNAQNAIKRFSGDAKKFVALDIGPSGRLLKPLGDLDFEDAVTLFAETVKIGAKCGADLILIETMNDSYETKAAVIAAKENSSLPIFVTNAYDESGKLMTNATPSAMVALLEGLGVDALGINCSLGPDKMMPVVEELLSVSSTPVIVSPNAGLPTFRDGKTVYDLDPDMFSDHMVKIAEMGAVLLGGCCGTTPEHIKKLKEKTAGIELKKTENKNRTVISTYTHALEFDRPVLIGERINPTGKPKFKAALREKNFEYILHEGLSQQDAGADVLDVNVGIPEIDEKEVLVRAVKELQTVTDLPLQIDTSDFDAMEAALRIYNGKPLINSVNGKQESMDKVLPLAAKYGGVVIALTLDEGGIPQTIGGRIELAERIIEEAGKYGISKKDIIVDPLAMTISSDSASALVTLGSIAELKKRGIKTSLGVSNVSFGLPERRIINSTFFAMALERGLDAAIMNPHSKEMLDVYYAFMALADLDERCEKYINYAAENQQAPDVKIEKSDQNPKDSLRNAILKGLKGDAARMTEIVSDEAEPIKIIDECIIPALNEIGLRFENKTAFLPQLLMSAEAAKAAFEVIRCKMKTDGKDRPKKMKIVIATVKGDIHDIGKNIVKSLLENYDFDVFDLGKDVAPELIVEMVKSEKASLVGLSALMTTTVPAMEETIRLLRKESPKCRVVVGGAVLTQEYADMIGADKYAKDAMETVRYAEKICAEKA